MSELPRVVVLAAGRGTRMRLRAPDAELDAAQAQAADLGLKALIPFNGEPFLSHLLSEIADAGFRDVCIVTRPPPDPVFEEYSAARTERLRITCAVQDEPLGSAHALAAAEGFAAGADIVLLNSDNFYPAAALRMLLDIDGSGLVGFRATGLLTGNVDTERLAAYAIIEADAAGALTDIVEKPGATRVSRAGDAALISMTCWRFRATIFDAIRHTPRSARGEYEVPDAVRIAMQNDRFTVVPATLPVLDLSHRSDIPSVGAALRGHQVRL